VVRSGDGGGQWWSVVAMAVTVSVVVGQHANNSKSFFYF
jgi:hypothetical protein